MNKLNYFNLKSTKNYNFNKSYIYQNFLKFHQDIYCLESDNSKMYPNSLKQSNLSLPFNPTS